MPLEMGAELVGEAADREGGHPAEPVHHMGVAELEHSFQAAYLATPSARQWRSQRAFNQLSRTVLLSRPTGSPASARR